MTLNHLGIIGAGAITGEMLAVLGQMQPLPVERISILVRPGRLETAQAGLAGAEMGFGDRIVVLDNPDKFIEAMPGLVIEAAGHGAVRAYVPELLRRGIETVIASTGALGDLALYAELKAAAIAGASRLVLPAGAVGAMDILAGLSYAQIHSVSYISRKPPRAWKGTRAETLLDLDNLREEARFFDGNARVAATDYPRNANVAASIALAGIGFERTRVQLIADPGVTGNTHVFTVSSQAGDVTFCIQGKPSPANPKTSLTTVYSLVREVMRRVEPIVS